MDSGSNSGKCEVPTIPINFRGPCQLLLPSRISPRNSNLICLQMHYIFAEYYHELLLSFIMQDDSRGCHKKPEQTLFAHSSPLPIKFTAFRI